MIDVDFNLIPEAVHGDRGVAPAAIARASRPPALSEAPDALGLLHALRRRWRIALASGLAVAAVAGLVAYLIIPRAKYTSRATLHVSTNPKYIIFDPKERLADYRTYQRTQVAMARSLYVLSDALKNPKVAGLPTVREQADPIEWLAKSIKIDFPDASEVLEISLSGDYAGDLVILVNSVVDSYSRLVVDEEQNERKTRLAKLRELWKRYQENLQDKRTELRTISDLVGSDDKQVLSMAHQSKIQNRDFAEQERLRVTFELRKAEAELTVLEVRAEAADRAIVPQAEIDERIEASPVAQALHEKVRRLTNSLGQVMRLSRAADDPAVVAARRDLDASRRDLANFRREARPTIVAAARESARKAYQEELASLRAQVSVSRAYLGAIEQDLERLRGESKAISRGSMDLSQQQDELQIVSDTARKIGSEVEAMDVELGAPPRVRIVDRATVPSRKDELRKVKAGLAAGAGSFLLILAAVTFWEFGARRINTVDQVVHGLGLRLIGSLPVVRERASRQGAAERDRSHSQLVESIDATRTMLLHASHLEGIRCVMITSASQGEGKTSLSSHLAISLARTGRRSLLIDADLHNSSTHRLFDIPRGPGLSEVLRGEVGVEQVIRSTSAHGLDLIMAGECDASAIRALSQDRARKLFDELKARYEFVIVDTAPVLLVADTLLFGQLADVVVLSILRDVSRVPMIHAAHERLSSLGVKILGAVVSGTPGGPHGYGRPYGSKDNKPSLEPVRKPDEA